MYVYAGVWEPALPSSSYSSDLALQIATLMTGLKAAEKSKQLDIQVAFLNVMVLLAAHVVPSDPQFKSTGSSAYDKLAALHAMVHHPKPAGYSVRQAEFYLACQQSNEVHDIIASELERHRQWCNGMKPLLERYQANSFGNLCAKFPF